MTLATHTGGVFAPGLRIHAARALTGNGMSTGLPLFERLAREEPSPLVQPLSAYLGVQIEATSFTNSTPAPVNSVTAATD